MNAPKVLVVEDEALTSQIISRYLTDWGYVLAPTVASGMEAVRIALEEHPDIVLMDIRLSGEMDGTEAAVKIREICDVPIVYLTAYSDDATLHKAQITSPYGYILKPAREWELRSTIEIALYRHEQEKRLRDSEERFRSLFDDSPISLWEEDATDLKKYIEQLRSSGVEDLGTYLEENPEELYHFVSLVKVINVNRATLDMYQVSDFEEFHIGLSKYFNDESYQAFKKGIIAQANGQTIFETDTVNLTYRGERLDIHIKWCLPPGHQEKWDKILISIVDITERKRAEAERERLLAQVREIMNAVPDGVLLLDASRRVVLANPVAQDYLYLLAKTQMGETLEYLGDQSVETLLSPPLPGLWHDVKSGSRSFQVVARLVEEDPESERWVMMVRDITQEREFQSSIQQQERLAAVGQMAAGIAHDFNNTLAVILLYTEMLLAIPDLHKVQRDRLQIIAKQARHASHLVQQILDFSRRAVLERRPMDLLPFMKEQVKMLERTLPENIKINFNFKAGEYLVNADPTRMQQAIINLAVNARDAMPEGGEIYLSLSRSEPGEEFTCVTCGQFKDGDWICIAIADTGCGISSESLPHIFEPFFTTKTPGKGAGLGLSQVYGIFKQHEGHVDVRTQVAQGSTFYLYLPALPIEKPQLKSAESETLPRGKGETILVVEDESTTSEALVASLTLLNYRVHSVQDGREALLFLEQHAGEVDLVLSDVVMPYMGGIALFNAIQERDLGIPLILMTGHPMQAELEQLQTEGLLAWMLKPPTLRQLALSVSQVLHKHHK